VRKMVHFCSKDSRRSETYGPVLDATL
jgi:hypothetical protein